MKLRIRGSVNPDGDWLKRVTRFRVRVIVRVRVRARAMVRVRAVDY